jgi:selenocysteine-specific elongation factor
MSHLVVGTAGHIDHGKSALVRALTGIDPDRLKEEKARGITIDLGFAHWHDGDRTVAFVDVPGHERFVRNMLAGAGGIDAVMLVVAADESVMPQTREHLAICRMLGVRQGLVVLTKADLVDEDTLALVRLDVAELVAGSFLHDAPVIAVSARTGAGLDDLQAALRAVVDRPTARDAAGAARLPIDRVFVMKGFGTVVTGTLVAGRISAETELEAVLSGRRLKVRGVQVHGATATAAEAGQRTALNLSSVEVADLDRGEVLADPGTLRATRLVDAWLETLPDAPPIAHGARVRLHQGTIEVLARVSIVAPPDEEHDAPVLEPGGRGFARLRLESPAAMTRGDRIVLRSYSPVTTIAGGVVLDPDAPRGGVRLAPTLRRLQRLLEPLLPSAETSELAAYAVLIAESGRRGLRAADLVWRCGVPPATLPAVRTALVECGAALDVGDYLVTPEWRPLAAERVRVALAAHHEASPLSDGLPREQVREGVLGGVAPGLVDLVLRELEATGQIVGRDRLALAGRVVSLSAEEAAVTERLESALRARGLTPPDVSQLPALVGSSAVVVERLLQLLVRQKRVFRLDSLPYHRDVLDRLRSEVSALKPADGEAFVDVSSFKSRYGLSRKFAIPLLEYLDRERVTRRVGERRLVL